VRLAQQLMDEALSRYQVASGQLTIHQDRGSPMIAHSYLDLLGERGVTGSHSRPWVSNDDPFSESQFKTTKYQPDYPGRFENVSHARPWFESYVDWYNFEHITAAWPGSRRNRCLPVDIRNWLLNGCKRWTAGIRQILNVSCAAGQLSICLRHPLSSIQYHRKRLNWECHQP
jgi:transposase InsO family protein